MSPWDPDKKNVQLHGQLLTFFVLNVGGFSAACFSAKVWGADLREGASVWLPLFFFAGGFRAQKLPARFLRGTRAEPG